MPKVVVCDFCQEKLYTVDPRPAGSKKRRHINDHIELYILPEPLHDSLVESGLYTREDCETTVPACYICATAATKSFSDQERVKYLNTSNELRLALEDLKWIPKKKNDTRSTLEELDKQTWNNKELRQYKLTRFSMVNKWDPTENLQDPLTCGQGMDMVNHMEKEALIREEALKREIMREMRREMDKESEAMKEKMSGYDERLEATNKRIDEVTERLEEVPDAGDLEEVKQLARESTNKTNILETRFVNRQDEHEAYKTETSRKIASLEELVQALRRTVDNNTTSMSAQHRTIQRLEQAEWRQAAAAPSDKKDKKKRKRENERSHAPVIPPTSSDAMANVKATLAAKNKSRVQVSFPGDETSDDSEDSHSTATEDSNTPLNQPAAKKQRLNKNASPRPGPAQASTSQLPAATATASRAANAASSSKAMATSSSTRAVPATSSSRPAPAPASASRAPPASSSGAAPTTISSAVPPSPARYALAAAAAAESQATATASRSIRGANPASSSSQAAPPSASRTTTVEVRIPIPSTFTNNASMPPPRPVIKKSTTVADNAVDPKQLREVFPSYRGESARAESVMLLEEPPSGSVPGKYRKKESKSKDKANKPEKTADTCEKRRGKSKRDRAASVASTVASTAKLE